MLKKKKKTNKKLITKTIFCISASFVLFGTVSISSADLLQIYSSSGKTNEKSSLGYEFGVNFPVLSNNNAGTQKIFDVNTGTNANKDSCSILGNMKFNLNSFFNAEKAVQGIMGNVQNAISAAPTTLLCYASQTLCDMYKFMRNMANFSAQMNVTSCQEYEKMGMQLADSMRKKKVQQCAMEKAQSGDPTEYQQYLSECEKEVDTLPINIPGTNETAKGSYKLSDQISKIFGNNSTETQIISKLLGDFSIGYNVGVKQEKAPLYGEDMLLSEYIEKYNNAVSDVVENYIETNNPVSPDTIKLISVPGFPITEGFMNKLRLLDARERKDFYEQYATVAGMYALTLKIEEAMKALDVAKNQTQDPDVRKVLQENLQSLKDKYDLMYKRLVLQKEFLAPMFKTISNYAPPVVTPDLGGNDLKPYIPEPLLQKQQ